MMGTLQDIYLEGASMKTELDFHKQINKLMDFGPYYGDNADALWDMLRGGGANRFFLHWRDSEMAKASIGKERFAIIIGLLNEATELPSYENNPYEFRYALE
jgi:ribonuclease inhibitor